MIRVLFEREVDYLWARLARAARGKDQLTSLWSRDSDPRMARLVQAAAYAFARVREKLEDDVPEISHALIASALPEVLRPTPSATVVQLGDPRRAWKNALTLAAGTRLQSRAIEGVPCLFGTSWPVNASPLVLARADVRPRESGVQVLTLRLEPYPGRALQLPDDLRIFVETADPILALDVVHGVCGTRAPLRVRALDGRGHELSVREIPGPAPAWTALQGTLSLSPAPPDRFASGTALRAFFGFPEAFGFFDLRGLQLATRALPGATRALELVIRLQGTVSETAMAAQFHLGCTPATNVFEVATVPLPVRALGPCGALTVPEHAARELVHLESVDIVPNEAPDRITPVHLWESYRGAAYLDDELYLRLTRRAPLGHGPTELRGMLFRPSGSGNVPRGFLQARGLATDGCRTDSLLRGDVSAPTDNVEMRNITRVTLPRAASFDERLPWRANAYARMPVAQFALAASLAAYLDIHDVTGVRRRVAPGAKPAVGGVISARRSSVGRVEGDEVFGGDEVELTLDQEVFGGTGATWLVGELLARSLAERADFLRYTRTRLLLRNGTVCADYGVRQGDRLPPPFG